jgi:alpha-tubulin suppressor-like RCC1 family protein
VRSLSPALVTVAVAGLVLASPVAGPIAGAEPVHTTAPADAPVASTYTPLTSARVLDTRSGAAVGPGGVVSMNLAGRVPATATAVVFNVTGIGPSTWTYVSASAHGQERSGVSNLNLAPGETRANLVTVSVGADRVVDLYNHAGSVHLVADLAGYYTTGTGSKFTPVDPHRELNTHVGTQSTTVLDLSLAVPPSATAVALTVTGARATHDTFVTAWPAGSTRPATSTVNVPRYGNTSNLTIVPLGPGRKVNLYNHVGELDLIADLAGFYTPEFGAVFTPVAPARVFDTRYGLGTWDGQLGPITGPANWAFRPGTHVPDDAIGAVFNLTGIEATASTFITAWQNRNVDGPRTSNVNLTPGQSAATLAVVPMVEEVEGTRAYIYNKAGQVDVAADLAGYFWVQKEPCTAGCAYVWGQNYGRLGDGTTARSTPTPSSLGLSEVVDMSTHLAVRSDGSVWGWGGTGLLAIDWFGADYLPFPVQVPRLAGVVAVAETSGTTLGSTAYAVTHAGTVWSWGSGGYGALGTGGVTWSSEPLRIPGLTGITATAGGAATGYALRNDGTVWAWGWNADGQLGNGSTAESSNVPVRVTGLSGVTAIAAGGSTAYALTADGSVWAWGSNVAGKLGNGPAPELSRVPVRIAGLSGVTAISAGQAQAFAVRDDGSVWSWGTNYRGGLGNGGDSNSSVPVQVLDITDAVAVTAAQSSGGLALDSTGRMWSWGDNDTGDLGVGSDIPFRNRPGVIPGLTGVSVLGAGGRVIVP